MQEGNSIWWRYVVVVYEYVTYNADNMESSGLPPAYPICLPQGQWEERRGDEVREQMRFDLFNPVKLNLSVISSLWYS